VIPYDERVARHVVIEAGRAHGAADRMAVGIDLAGPPDENGIARGSVVEVLGYPDEPGMDIEIIIRKYELRHEWPEEVAEEAEAIPDAVDPGEIARRTDFTSLPTVTIDGETARDFDDAISVERLPRGRWRLHVHIADVAHYVPPGGALDREAFARGTSVYFPGRAVPMLPEKLSNDLCSLKPGVARLVQSVVLELDAAGETREARFADGVIHSMERMTYTQVARILVERDAEMLERYAPQVEMFRDMERLCGLLQARRRKRGSIDFDLPAPEIVLNARGEMTGVFPTKRNIAHQIIEEFMLAANEAVAVHLVETGAPALFRGHEEPEERRLEGFDEVLQGLGYRLPRPFDAIEPRHLQDLLDLVAGKPEERFVSQLMLRAMRQARYDPQNLGHFGLAASHYTHFTSPIRRYPDLVVHRALRAQQRGEFRGDDAAENRLRSALPEIAAQSSRTERVAEDAERELMAWKKMGFMGEKLGEEFHASVTGVMPFGMFLELEEYFVEGLVHISTLSDDEYRFEERGHLLRGHLLRGRESARVFRLGDRVRARVVKVDHFLKRMDLELVEKGKKASRPAGGRSKKRRKAGREPQPKPRPKSKRRKRRG